MSLSRLAMRIAAARALKGATLAEARVFDSSIDPIDQAVQENRQPFLVVTTDDHESTITGRDLSGGDESCDLVIEAAIASRLEVVEGNVDVEIPHTDEGMELVLDIIEHQAMDALIHERSDWSRIWMKFVPRIKRRVSKRGASAEGGVRFAARQITLTCDLISTPNDGVDIQAGTPWADLLAAMAADEALAPVGELLQATIVGPAAIDEWKRDANILGIHQSTATALAIGPGFFITGDRQGPPNEEEE